jgi:hypothetical protein
MPSRTPLVAPLPSPPAAVMGALSSSPTPTFPASLTSGVSLAANDLGAFLKLDTDCRLSYVNGVGRVIYAMPAGRAPSRAGKCTLTLKPSGGWCRQGC